jgi:hypothetical protein
VIPVTNSQPPNDADFARMEGELFDRITVRHRRQVVRHRLLAAAALVVVAGAGVAAGTIANPSQQRDTASCYGGDSLTSQVSQGAASNNTDFSVKTGVPPSAAKVARVVSMCGNLWEAGRFGSPQTTAPKLQACLQDNLVIAVFPKKNASESADAFCTKLGLSAP